MRLAGAHRLARPSTASTATATMASRMKRVLRMAVDWQAQSFTQLGFDGRPLRTIITGCAQVTAADRTHAMEVLTTRMAESAPNPSAGAHALARLGNRRRLVVFGGAFLVSLLLGQVWNFARSDVFRATSRLQISLPDAGGPGSAASTAYATELQALNSRPLLAKVARAMKGSTPSNSGTADDEVTRLQALLQVQPLAGSDVVQLMATGEVPLQLATLLNTIPEVVRTEMVARQARAADSQLDGARKELIRLEAVVAERRAQPERFRSSAGLQAERDENEAVSRSKGLSNALNTAIEKEALVAARLRALTDSHASGRSGMGARDDPTLTGIEARTSQAREELGEMERAYTPDFMAMDPRARALRARLAELERQTAQQRSAGQQAAM